MKKILISSSGTILFIALVVIASFFMNKSLLMVYPDTYEEIATIGDMKMYVVCKEGKSTNATMFSENIVLDDHQCELRSPVMLNDGCEIVYKTDISSCVTYSIKGAVKFKKVTLGDLANSYLFDCTYK
jgi:hypothetical protein